MLKLLAISGSLRRASTNSALLRAMASAAPETCRIRLYDRIGELPVFNPDDEGDRTPAVARDWIEAVIASDGLIISSPEYAHGVPGGLKNALDWLVSQEQVVNKPVLLVHAATRSRHARGALLEIVRTMSLDVAPYAFERHLLGKSPNEIAALLDEPDTSAELAECIGDFAKHIALKAH